MPILEARAVRKVYRSGADEVEALRGVDFTVAEGEWVSVMGPSGSGKTTLLNCLSGLDDIDGGHVLLDGTDLHAMSAATPRPACHERPRAHPSPCRGDGVHLPGLQPDPGVQRGGERRAAAVA